jgi:hypothetical protein
MIIYILRFVGFLIRFFPLVLGVLGGQVVPFLLEDKRMKNHRLVLHAEFRIEV